MEKEIQKELLARVDLLAEKIGQTGSDLFASYVQWTQLEPWIYIIATVITFIVCAIAVKVGIYGHLKNIEECKRTGNSFPDKGDIYIIPSVIIGVIVGTLFLVFSINAVIRLPNLIVPEKEAFSTFVRDIKRLGK